MLSSWFGKTFIHLKYGDFFELYKNLIEQTKKSFNKEISFDNPFSVSMTLPDKMQVEAKIWAYERYLIIPHNSQLIILEKTLFIFCQFDKENFEQVQEKRSMINREMHCGCCFLDHYNASIDFLKEYYFSEKEHIHDLKECNFRMIDKV